MKNCKHCNKPIVLVPSAAERAAKDTTGKTAAYYTGRRYVVRTRPTKKRR